MSGKDAFREKNWSAVPIRDLGLAIAGTRLEPVIEEFRREIHAKRIQVEPRFYLSTDWGVVTGTVAIAIPFYLAEPQLSDLHAREVGLIEGEGRAELLRYLRHEMGHVVNYAYKLYDDGEWVKLFGPITQPYLEEFRPSPFSRRYVRHLPGWYAQKHPDEDWAETFAVWMTPGLDWRGEYAEQPAALAKLEYCDRLLEAVRERAPIVTESAAEEDVGELAISVEQYYREQAPPKNEFPRLFDGALRAIFEPAQRDEASEHAVHPASRLIRAEERQLVANVYRWTGHFPERTRALVRHLAERADALGLTCSEADERKAALALTTFVSALAMNYVQSGNYLP